jgi:hypothetical protein
MGAGAAAALPSDLDLDLDLDLPDDALTDAPPPVGSPPRLRPPAWLPKWNCLRWMTSQKRPAPLWLEAARRSTHWAPQMI